MYDEEDETRPLQAISEVPPARQPRSRGPRLSRRGLLVGAGAVGVSAAAITSGVILSRGGVGGFHPGSTVSKAAPIGDQQITHLMRRAGFGARASEIQEFSSLGLQGTINRLLNYAQVSDDIDTRLIAAKLDLTKIADQQRWWALRMIYSKRPFLEKMTLFWHGLLTSSYNNVGGSAGYPFIMTQNQFLRNNALGRFDDILLGITSDPAMMWWLDLRLSTKKAPNENYARELMELFSMGVNSGYTQTDVHEGARALTGWRLQNKATQANYDPNQHDTGQKTFLGQTGSFDYHDVIRLVASHPATGPFLCKRIFRFFVHEHPSDADVKPMVDAYLSHDHSIAAVMQAMFLSPAFFSADAYRSRLKSPVELVIGAIRQLELEVDGTGVANLMTQMGQTLFDPPNVAGWPGDQSSVEWLNTGTWLARVNFINTLLSGNGKSQPSMNTQLQDVINRLTLRTTDDVLTHYAHMLVDDQLSADRKQVVQGYLTSTGATGTTLKLANGQTIPSINVRGMVYLLMACPEYHFN